MVQGSILFYIALECELGSDSAQCISFRGHDVAYSRCQCKPNIITEEKLKKYRKEDEREIEMIHQEKSKLGKKQQTAEQKGVRHRRQQKTTTQVLSHCIKCKWIKFTT